MLTNQDLILIEDYLDGILSEKNIQKVEQRIVTDIEFRKEVRFREEINVALMEVDLHKLKHETSHSFSGKSKTLHRSGLKENVDFMREKNVEMNIVANNTKNVSQQKISRFKNNIDEAEQVYFKKKNQSKIRKILFNKSSIIIIAASLTLLIGLSSLIQFGQPQYISGDNLFSIYYQSYENLDYYKANKGLFEKAMENYDQGNYKVAIEGLTKLANNVDFTISASFYLGISYIETHDYYNAVFALQKAANSRSTLSTDASWYLGLSYLKLDKKAEAIEQFKKVAKSNHPAHKDNAKQILKKIKL